MNKKQVKLSRLFKDGHFKGYVLSVDGLLLSSQQYVSVETQAKAAHAIVTVTFAVTDEMVADAPDIHI
ncbi:hypothetical protein [Xenorhabdus szentirmaii]|uniref:hypothetical protein n=1 Tax=Xenorhabdus szentirmaii TaxID=290112 RepID=UPI000C051499|nr:hypothetical protein [Xenorhabdus szentirmaii]PHM40502.1 hypothetical protein Xszus_00162 [Xenorhabdus szentirmaii]